MGIFSDPYDELERGRRKRLEETAKESKYKSLQDEYYRKKGEAKAQFKFATSAENVRSVAGRAGSKVGRGLFNLATPQLPRRKVRGIFDRDRFGR